jgi:hypothetical protein
MKTIPLKNGNVATVDDEDFKRINQYVWYALCFGKHAYARRWAGKWPKQKQFTCIDKL